MLLTGTIVVAPDGSVRSYAIDHVEKVVGRPFNIGACGHHPRRE